MKKAYVSKGTGRGNSRRSLKRCDAKMERRYAEYYAAVRRANATYAAAVQRDGRQNARGEAAKQLNRTLLRLLRKDIKNVRSETRQLARLRGHRLSEYSRAYLHAHPCDVGGWHRRTHGPKSYQRFWRELGKRRKVCGLS